MCTLQQRDRAHTTTVLRIMNASGCMRATATLQLVWWRVLWQALLHRRVLWQTIVRASQKAHQVCLRKQLQGAKLVGTLGPSHLCCLATGQEQLPDLLWRHSCDMPLSAQELTA